MRVLQVNSVVSIVVGECSQSSRSCLLRFIYKRVTTPQWGRHQHRLSLQQAAGISVSNSDSGGRQGQTSTISPRGPRKLPGCFWRSSDPLLLPGFPSLIQLERVSTSWTMKKWMLLTGPGNFPGGDFNQAPHGLHVYHAAAQHRLLRRGANQFSNPGVGGDPPRERFLVRSVEAKHVTEPRSEPSWVKSERSDQPEISFFSPLWFWDSSVG